VGVRGGLMDSRETPHRLRYADTAGKDRRSSQIAEDGGGACQLPDETAATSEDGRRTSPGRGHGGGSSGVISAGRKEAT